MELQRPFQRDDRARNKRLAGLAERVGIPTVATGNVHAHARSRGPLQDAFVALRNHATLDASEPLRRGNFSHVLSSPKAMEARFADDHPEALQQTRELADRLTFDLNQDLGYRYPGSEDPEANRNLAELCALRFDERYPPTSPHRDKARPRLEEELRVIDALGLPGFFLLHRDMLELAREVAVEVRGPDTARALLPPGRGRGSSVSSIVCYLTGLSHIDPIANELFLGRFLNEELTALPDIDLDFPRDIREVLIPRVHDRYGREHSALVAAFPTFKSRGAIRELGKVLGLPAAELERVARGAEPFAIRGVAADVENALGLEPGGPPAPWLDPDSRGPFAMTAAEWQAMVSGEDPGILAKERPPADDARAARLPGRWAWLARLCNEAYGLPRHLSQHSGGMIVSTRPLVDCCPVLPAAMEGRQLCQWDKDSCADAGFLKIDLLGLGMLSAVERCVEDIARTRNERIDLSRIPFDDAATYDAIQDAETMGVFQIESRAQMASLRRTRPENLDDLTIQVAIVRPGPIQGGAVNPYIERRQRLREDPDYVVPYDHPSLEPVLKDTLGTIIFQDQVLEVAIAFAGFSPGEAEGLRRAMSRKRSEAAIEAYHRRFVEGAIADPRRRRADRRAGLRDDHGLLGLRLPEGPRRRLRPARLPVDVAARALRPGVPVRAAQRAADGLLRLRHARARGAAARDPAPRRRRQRQRGRLHDRRRGRPHRPRLRLRRARRRGRRARRARARRAARSARSATSPRAPAPGARRSPSSRGRARATRSRRATPPAARCCGSSGSPRPATRCPTAPSSRCRSTCPTRRRCASSSRGSR